MSRHSTRNKVSAFSEAHEIPDVDVIQETWAPTKAQFDAYKRREVEMACIRQSLAFEHALLESRLYGRAVVDMGMDLFSYDTWLRALIGVGW